MPGTRLWHERQSGRVRAAWVLRGQKVTRSKAIEAEGLGAAVLWCLCAVHDTLGVQHPGFDFGAAPQ